MQTLVFLYLLCGFPTVNTIAYIGLFFNGLILFFDAFGLVEEHGFSLLVSLHFGVGEKFLLILGGYFGDRDTVGEDFSA